MEVFFSGSALLNCFSSSSFGFSSIFFFLTLLFEVLHFIAKRGEIVGRFSTVDQDLTVINIFNFT